MLVFQDSLHKRSTFITKTKITFSLSSMTFSLLPILITLSNLLRINAQNATVYDTENLHSFHPSLAAVIGVISIMLSIVIIVIAYAKFCHRTPFNLDTEFQIEPTRSLSSLSGIDKTFIDKIPIFRFSSLRGSKHGLECSVCLSAFEDVEILKLLPKCKHAFHRNCIDEWLECHSTCPLCRLRFEPLDVTSFVFSNRLFHTPSNLTDDPCLELLIQREQDESEPSMFHYKNKRRKAVRDQKLHKVKHRIIVSDVVLKHRWSDVNSSDLISLNSDMLHTSSSQRFSSFGSKSTRFASRFPMSNDVLKIKDEMEKKRRINESSKFNMMQRSSSVSTSMEVDEAKMMMNQNGKRSMSEITNVSRFKDQTGRFKAIEFVSNSDEERRRRLWLQIARRTLQWFAGFDKSQQQPDHVKMLPSNV